MVVEKSMLILIKSLRSFSGLQINIYKRVMKCKLIFFLTIYPTSFVDLPKKNIKRSQVQTKKYVELNLIELFFLILCLDDLSFAKKKKIYITSKLACL